MNNFVSDKHRIFHVRGLIKTVFAFSFFVLLFFSLNQLTFILPSLIPMSIFNNQSNTTKTVKPRFQHDITIVSSYFLLNKSKHNKEKYRIWISNFFQSVSSPLILFTNNKSIDQELLNLRKNLPTTLYFYNSHWDILKELETNRNKSYSPSYLNIQHGLDSEKTIHNPDLYAIWNTKTFITYKISQENPYGSQTFIYTDAGAWRYNVYPDWPNKTFTTILMNDIKDKILIGQVKDLTLLNNSKFPDVDLIQGGFFLGSKKAIEILYKNFWNIHDERMDKNLFVGIDQNIMNILAFEKYSKSVVRLKSWYNGCKSKTNIWFFYQKYLASDDFYGCSQRESLLIV